MPGLRHGEVVADVWDAVDIGRGRVLRCQHAVRLRTRRPGRQSAARGSAVSHCSYLLIKCSAILSGPGLSETWMGRGLDTTMPTGPLPCALVAAGRAKIELAKETVGF